MPTNTVRLHRVLRATPERVYRALGSGEHFLNGINMDYECAKYVAGERAAHVFLHKHA